MKRGVAEDLGQEDGSLQKSGKRLLVAEDNPVTQDLLKLFLGQRGHHVDIVQDGESALQALRRQPYDVALLDFHLPKMDGLKVAAAFRSSHEGGGRPWFVAITADTDGLTAREDYGANFDQIIPKPLDIHEVCSLVEGLSEHGGEQPGEAATPGGTAQPALEFVGLSSDPAQASESRRKQGWIETLGHEFLRYPDDVNAARLSARGMRAIQGDGTFDALLVTAPTSPEELAPVWQKKCLHLLPVIDLAGSLGPRADLGGSGLGYGENEKLERLIRQFHQRRGELHRDLVMTDEMGEKLLGRIYVSDGPLQAAHNPNVPPIVSYNATLRDDVLIREATRLADTGFLDRQFFDRLQVCDRCHSSRFNVREECANCRSPDLLEEPYLHHFKCAYQGVESDFRRGDALICPKCRQELSHFSVDYDKPGSLVRCLGCGNAASEPAVGFQCLDCGSHFDGDSIAFRDAYSFTLTDQALAFLETGRAFLGPAQQTLRFSDLPLQLVVALNGEARQYNESKVPFALLDISYQREREIVREAGPRQFAQARDMILENLRNLLRKEDRVVKGHSSDYVLMKAVGPDEAREGVTNLASEAGRDLRLDLGIRIHVFGPEDFA